MKLQIEQKQKLNVVITSELRQAIELLQYSTHELYHYLKEQELENPLIDLVDKNIDSSYTNQFKHSSSQAEFSMDSLEFKEVHMRSDLIQEASIMFKCKETKKLLKYLINLLDDHGYLRLDKSFHNLFDTLTIEKGIHLLQQIGPTGIGARNLKECLLLQIAYDHPNERSAYSLIQDHLELLASGNKSKIASLMNISIEEIDRIHHLIQTLNPKPCSFMSDFKPHYVFPDLIVENSDHGLSFYLNDSFLPQIHVNKEYMAHMNNHSSSSNYLLKKYQQYQWLVKSIEQRRMTLNKIVSAIIAKQEAFFKEGFTSLNPMTLMDIAQEIGMHESTVSRATKNKMIQTPKGTFPLKSLFTSKIVKTDGSNISTVKVKELLKRIIDQEDKQKPWSDQKITEYFNTDKEIKVSRRTISKYREELNIPSSRLRKVK